MFNFMSAQTQTPFLQSSFLATKLPARAKDCSDFGLGFYLCHCELHKVPQIISTTCPVSSEKLSYHFSILCGFGSSV